MQKSTTKHQSAGLFNQCHESSSISAKLILYSVYYSVHNPLEVANLHSRKANFADSRRISDERYSTGISIIYYPIHNSNILYTSLSASRILPMLGGTRGTEVRHAGLLLTKVRVSYPSRIGDLAIWNVTSWAVRYHNQGPTGHVLMVSYLQQLVRILIFEDLKDIVFKRYDPQHTLF